MVVQNMGVDRSQNLTVVLSSVKFKHKSNDSISDKMAW